MSRESVIFKLDCIDKENFRNKLANDGLVTMQDYLEECVKQYIKEDSNGIVKEYQETTKKNA